MSIYQRKNSKYYYYRFEVDGKSYQGSTKKTNKKEAAAFEKQLKQDIKTHSDGSVVVKNLQKKLTQKSVRVDDAFKEFEIVASPGKIRTENQRKKYITDFLQFAKDNSIEYIHEIDTALAKEYFQFISSKGKYDTRMTYTRDGKTVEYNAKRKPMAKQTINNYLIYIKVFFNEMKEIGATNENPFAAKSIKVKRLSKSHIHREAFSPEELVAMADYTRNPGNEYHFLYPVICVGANTGLRRGDICNLRWENVDLNARCLKHVVTSKSSEPVYIPIFANSLYQLLVDSRERKRGYVFPDLAELYKSNNARISKFFKKLLDLLEIKHSVLKEGRGKQSSTKDIHSLRHTFAYLAAVNNVPFTIVQAILGHMTADLTKMYMEHSTFDAKRDMLKKIPDYVGGNVIDVKSVDILDLIKEKLNNMNELNWEQVKGELLELLN